MAIKHKKRLSKFFKKIPSVVHKIKKRSIPRMGVVGGLTGIANNLSGHPEKNDHPYEGGIGGAVVKGINTLGHFFNPSGYKDIQ